MNTKKITSLAAAAVVMLTSSVTASAETVSDDDLQEITFTITADERADLASDNINSLAIGGGGDIAEPQMHKNVTHTFTSSQFSVPVGTDSTLLNETVQLKDITFSDNIGKIKITLMRHLTEADLCEITLQHSNSETFDVPAGIQYRIFMQVFPAAGKTIDKDHPGTVSFYWTDRSWEVTE